MIVDARRDDAGAKEYLDKALDANFVDPFCGFTIINEKGAIVGAFIFNTFTDCNIDISLACEEMLTLRVVRFMARIAFLDLKVKRVTARTRAKNEKAIKAIKQVGFEFECLVRDYFKDDDCAMFGMLARNQKLVRI